MATSTQQLPIEDSVAELIAALDRTHNVVLSAEPGAGKTTYVPLVLLQRPWLTGKRMIMLEPRRLAARRAAEYMSRQIRQDVGDTIGYRMRGETRVSRRTRIEIVTEAVLTRQLQNEPDLPGIGLLIFDEFHERSIHADLGLALALDVQQHIRPDLRILVMSATLDGISLQSLLSDAPIVTSIGRQFPVVTRYLGSSGARSAEAVVADATRLALDSSKGDLLVFLPGRREIRRVETLLFERRLPQDVVVHTLFGGASPDQQRAALSPAPSGFRKIILSTSVAETSLTIDGVRVVVDSGLARVPRFDPRRGMTGLDTVPVSQATADQRRGRAGRQAPGFCFRTWTENEHGQLQRFPTPEILATDLAPLAVDLARWGSMDGKNLRFLNPPPEAHLRQAQRLLRTLGAIDDSGRLTPHGRAIADLPLHPRLAHMVVRGNERGFGELACDLAALLEETEMQAIRRDSGIDLAQRLHAMKSHDGAYDRVLYQARRLRDITGVLKNASTEEPLGVLLGLAYPERLARRRDGETRRYLMANGTGATLPEGSLLAREQFLAIGEVDGVGSEVRVYLASPITKNEITEYFADQLTIQDETSWDAEQESVLARRVTRLGAIPVASSNTASSSETVTRILVDAIRALGLSALPWSKDAETLCSRSEWIRSRGLEGEQWPNLSASHLLDTLADWLSPHLIGKWRRSQLQDLHLSAILRGLFQNHQLQQLDRLAPSHVNLPSGSRVAIDYTGGSTPVLAVRLQEMFGQGETPRIGGGRIPLLLHLLSPAHRPLAVTQDLASFWQKTYPEIRTSMRARYPRHAWPDDPLNAAPPSRHRRRS
jgi:ATP-dependent helicase HrpB